MKTRRAAFFLNGYPFAFIFCPSSCNLDACTHKWIKGGGKENSAAPAVGISVDLNRESILTVTNDVTLTLKMIRIEIFPIFRWFLQNSE